MLIKEILLKTELSIPVINILDKYARYLPAEAYFNLCDELLKILHK